VTSEHQHRLRALTAALHGVPAKPVDGRNPLATLRPLFDGTMTIAEALTPEVQEAIQTCEQLAYGRDQRGRYLCDRLGGLRPIPTERAVVGW
jgi:hypothetical protein